MYYCKYIRVFVPITKLFRVQIWKLVDSYDTGKIRKMYAVSAANSNIYLNLLLCISHLPLSSLT